MSDGLDSVDEIISSAIRKGIQAISITDHDTLSGSFKAMEIVERESLPILVIPGYELSAKEGHLLVFGIEDEIEKEIEIKQACEIVKRKKGVSVLPHPYQFFRHGVMRPQKIIEYVDAVEIFNSRTISSIFNRWAAMLAAKNNKGVIAGSDAHSAESVGYGITMVKVKDQNFQIKDILESIKNDQTLVSGLKYPLRKIIGESLRKLRK
jgi:hypothetical protein